MTHAWKTIAEDFAAADEAHNILVIGSGYGGGVAASRLARTGQTVTVIERGREVVPGAYPNTMTAGLKECSVTLSHLPDVLGNPDGLFDLRIGDDVNVFVGRGLGGTSLINANVAVEPDPRIYEHFPRPFSAEMLRPYFDKARTMLGSNVLPKDQNPPKLQALEKVAEGLKSTVKRADINVQFADGLNAAGVMQFACNHCGDCVSGCNVGAKNTVLMNYLPDAKRHGAQIYTGAEVTHLTYDGTEWEVHTKQRSTPLRAKIVILAAGTLGSTEILLRSKSLDLSDQLGRRFSGNGDIWAFGYNANMPDEAGGRLPVFGVGAGTNEPADDPAFAPGPCITGMIHLKGANLKEDVLIEEGVMPGMFAAGYAAGFPALDALMGDPFRFGDVVQRLMDAAALGEDVSGGLSGLAKTAYDGPVSRTVPFLVMSHDASAGRLELSADKVVVNWPDAGLDTAIVNDAHVIQHASDAVQAEYLPLPFWQDAFNNRLLTVHPIGGCGLGLDHTSGVVNAKCQVFDPAGSGVHKGLYVCDGAIMPCGIGVNPHLTITAIAEYAIAELARDHGWVISDAAAPIVKSPTVSSDGGLLDQKLKLLLSALRDAEVAFDDGHPDGIRDAIALLWKVIKQAYNLGVPADLQQEYPIAKTAQILDILKDDKALLRIARPMLVQLRNLLDAVLPKVKAKDVAGAITALEKQAGDFSPSFGFLEIMRGTLSQTGLFDEPQPRDPHVVAAQGGQDVVLTATIHTDQIKSATTQPGGALRILDGTLESDAIGGCFQITEGTFQSVVPVPDEIEKWEMRYAGKARKGDEEITFNAFKTMQRRPGSHWWLDMNELRIDIKKDAETIARGFLTLAPEDLIKQVAEHTSGYPDGSGETSFGAFYQAFAGAQDFDLPTVLADRDVRANIVKGFAYALDNGFAKTALQRILVNHYMMDAVGQLALTTLRNYGQVFSYAANINHHENSKEITVANLPEPTRYYPVTEDFATLQLTRFKGGDKGPVVLAGGLGTKAMSFAMGTIKENFVQTLVNDGFDVWLFDYRGSGAIDASLGKFALEDVAAYDWPKAIETILAETGADSVQAVVHCIGSMSLFMAMLDQKLPVRSVIASATGPHAISNWYNDAKSDAQLASYFESGLPEKMWGLVDMFDLPADVATHVKNGLPVFDPRAPSPLWSDELNAAVDGLVWNVPSFAPLPCNSPTCHRINFCFGPSYLHDQLNHATHNAIEDVFGPLSTHVLISVAKIFATGYATTMDGSRNYLDGIDNLTMPIHFIVGDRNQEMLPEATLRSLDWLHSHFKDDQARYTRKVYPGYGHMDTFIGKDASKIIFPELLAILQTTA